jgi:hypothetical protein
VNVNRSSFNQASGSSEAKIAVRLKACLSGALSKDGSFSTTAFFNQWFRQEGKAYHFVFKKNLKVTNLQIAELRALLNVHLKRTGTQEHVRDLQAVSIAEFISSMQSIFKSFEESTGSDRAVDIVSRLYSGLLRDIVVLDVFFGSCGVFLPPDLDIDLPPVCAQSGYIHSCGRSLLVRNITKAKKTELFAALTTHLASGENQCPVRFIVYAHEEFTDHDRFQAGELRDGLDDLKLYMDKYFIGQDSLVSVLKEIRGHANFVDRLEVPEPLHYAKTLEEEEKGNAILDEKPTIWLIVDRKPGTEIRHKGDEQYFVVYYQQVINQNSLHLFDENKPAWIDHTTIPHTLVSAMFNVTRPWWSRPRGISFGDPFVGTGTTWLEALKYECLSICYDNEPLSVLMVEDNLKFMCSSNDQIEKYAEVLRQAATIDPTTKLYSVGRYAAKHRNPTEEDFFWALDRYEEVCPDQRGGMPGSA